MKNFKLTLLFLLIASCQSDKGGIRQNQDAFIQSVKKPARISKPKPSTTANQDNAVKKEVDEILDTSIYTNNYANEGEDHVSKEEEAWVKDAQKLTHGFSNFPSSTDLNNHLNDVLSPPAGGCLNFINHQGRKIVASPAVRGARKVYATMFQSCNVFDKVIDNTTPSLRGVSSYPSGANRIRKITNHKQYEDSHIVLSALDEGGNYPGPSCEDVRKMPPVYGYGSRKAPNNSGELNLFSKGEGVSSSSLNASGIDCSSFISVALATQGLKVTKNSPPFDPFTTSGLQQSVKGKNSCLENVKFSENTSIAPGDMINVAASHIVMIDEVGDDPLAIQKYASLNQCHKIKVSDFNFTYIHSGNVNNSYGPSRVHISKHNGGQMFDNLRMTAIKSCMNIVKGMKGEFNSKDLNINRKFDIVRHKSSDPSCISDKKIKLKNEECIDGCYADFEETIN